MPTINVTPDSDEELQLIADTLGKSRKVVVVTGAGISTNCGIPVSSTQYLNNACINPESGLPL
jgi:NAD-dependent histone deacetylase SIR2